MWNRSEGLYIYYKYTLNHILSTIYVKVIFLIFSHWWVWHLSQAELGSSFSHGVPCPWLWVMSWCLLHSFLAAYWHWHDCTGPCDACGAEMLQTLGRRWFLLSLVTNTGIWSRIKQVSAQILAIPLTVSAYLGLLTSLTPVSLLWNKA